MKKITFLLLMFAMVASAQQKSTGVVQFLPNLSAQLLLNNANSRVTLTINGPTDRWFAITLGSFGSGFPGAMSSGNDVVYYNGTTLVDARHNGQGNAPSNDAVNNWTLVSNTVAGGSRTIVATRAFTGDATDYTFAFSSTTIDMAGAHADSPILTTLQYHGTNRFNAQNLPLTTLGAEDFSLSALQIFPNPSSGEFVIKSHLPLTQVNVYTHVGAFVKNIKVPQSDTVEVNVSGLAAGIYLIEVQSNDEKTWKKVVIN